jgi:hypothetical protein
MTRIFDARGRALQTRGLRFARNFEHGVSMRQRRVGIFFTTKAREF